MRYQARKSRRKEVYRDREERYCRRLWYWDGAASDFQIATDGTKRPDNCQFTVTVAEIILTDVIEIIPATETAEKCIKEIKEWKR